MRHVKSRDSETHRSPWTPIRLCECCGKFIVLLRIPENLQRPDRRKWITCYLKGWDGNPFYVGAIGLGGNAKPHPTKRYAKMMRDKAVPKPTVDPFFTLDAAE